MNGWYERGLNAARFDRISGGTPSQCPFFGIEAASEWRRGYADGSK